MTNEAYTGAAVWGVKSKDEKAQEPVRVEGAWPALVSRETFDLVQQGLHERGAGETAARTGGQPVSPERPAPLWCLRQALLRPGGQERPVRLLRLREPVPRGRRGLHRPLPECHQGGGPGNRESAGADSHRGDRHRVSDVGGRGDRQHRRRGQRVAYCHQQRAFRRGHPIGEPLPGVGDQAVAHRGACRPASFP